MMKHSCILDSKKKKMIFYPFYYYFNAFVFNYFAS